MITELLNKWCAENNIPISSGQTAAFEKYASLLVEWNKKINLTAITEESEIAVKHFIDSISLLKAVDIRTDASLIDIGTGAGFPGIPLKIMRPDIKLTLLDSLNKRLIFLDDVCSSLGIEAELIHGRAEEMSQNKKYREKFDYAVSRAVANLPALCEYCIPYVRVGGSFAAMKGPDGQAELESASKAISTLGCTVSKTETFTLPDNISRTIIELRKVSPTPPAYPRRSTKINKSPIL